MEAIAFYGASDDLIEVEGSIPGCDEFNGENESFVVCGLRVEVGYTPRGVWDLTISQIDEGVPVTAERMKLSVQPRSDGSPGYSMRLDMEVPNGSVIVREAS